MSDKLANPGVRFPPPFIFVAGFLLGMLLNRWWPLALMPSRFRVVGLLGGWGLVGLWALIAFSAVREFLRARTSLIPHRPASSLVQSGIYRRTRNPMYLSLTSLYLGLALLVNQVWPIVLLPVVLVALQRLVVRREERYLKSEFGADYEAYTARVPRWL